MGYTTEFSGSFKLNKPLTAEQMSVLDNFRDNPAEDSPCRWGACDWIPSRDGKSIHHSGDEKSYENAEVLNYLISHFFKPWGLTLNGTVEWIGEDEEVGTITITDNVLTFTGNLR